MKKLTIFISVILLCISAMAVGPLYVGTHIGNGPGITNAIGCPQGYADAVRTWGVHHDGLDTSGPLQTVINYCWSTNSATNHNVYLEQGTYTISSGLYFPSAAITDPIAATRPLGHTLLGGDGERGQTYIFFFANNVICISKTNTFNPQGEDRIVGISFFGPQCVNGDPDVATDVSSAAIQVGVAGNSGASGNVQFFEIHNCLFQGWTYGVQVSNSWNTLISNCEFYKTTKAAINFSGVHNSLISHCLIKNPWNNRYSDKGIWYQKANPSAGVGDDACILATETDQCTNAVQNDGDVAIVANDLHVESFASVYTATNGSFPAMFNNVYFNETANPATNAWPAVFNLSSDAGNFEYHTLGKNLISARPLISLVSAGQTTFTNGDVLYYPRVYDTFSQFNHAITNGTVWNLPNADEDASRIGFGYLTNTIIAGPTNSSFAPDFIFTQTETNIGAAFTLSLPLHVNASKNIWQKTVLVIRTNGVSGSPFALTTPTGANGSGTAFVTNTTLVFVEAYGNEWTNYNYQPVK